MNKHLKIIIPILTFICITSTACANNRTSMNNSIEAADKVLSSINDSQVSGNIMKVELFADKTLLKAEATRLKARVIALDGVEQRDFAAEQKNVQEKINTLVLSTTKLKGKIMRIQAIEATQKQLEQLSADINHMRASSKIAKLELQIKYHAAIDALAVQETEMKTRITELTASIKDGSESVWDTLKAASDKTWASLKSGVEELKNSIKKEL